MPSAFYLLFSLFVLPATAGAQPQPAVDFRAVSADGTLVSDLKAAELLLKIDGTPRQVQTLRWVPALSSRAPAPYGTNAPTAAASYDRGGDDSLLPIVRETAGYHVATFAAEPSDRRLTSYRLEMSGATGPRR